MDSREGSRCSRRRCRPRTACLSKAQVRVALLIKFIHMARYSRLPPARAFSSFEAAAAGTWQGSRRLWLVELGQQSQDLQLQVNCDWLSEDRSVVALLTGPKIVPFQCLRSSPTTFASTVGPLV